MDGRVSVIIYAIFTQEGGVGMENINGFTPAQNVHLFCQAAVQLGLVAEEEQDFVQNALLDLFRLEASEEAASLLPIHKLSEELVIYAVSQGLCEDSAESRERFEARLYGLVTQSPRLIRQGFEALYQQKPEQATDWFYKLCKNNDYIRTRQIALNQRFSADSASGKLEITINLSKPEKDPRDIAAARNQPSQGYPRCLLCKENPGYAGRPGYPARQNHRMIPLTLHGEPWFFQYSPYLYYEEHCIVLNSRHVPMKVNRQSFEKMFDFVDQFPHYFIGANADIPIVGGSILSHDHFQGGRHRFPMERAALWFDVDLGVKGIKAEALRWPISCLRLQGRDRAALLQEMVRVLDAWKAYSDEGLGILARTEARHNAITPVIRRERGQYSAYLLLRNNRQSEEHPLGIYHPHQELHHIKKENIGLIEAMGLFILPGRLKKELKELEQHLAGKALLPEGSPHAAWAEELRPLLPEDRSAAQLTAFLRAQLGLKCERVLYDCGVFKQDEEGEKGFRRFLASLN